MRYSFTTTQSCTLWAVIAITFLLSCASRWAVTKYGVDILGDQALRGKERGRMSCPAILFTKNLMDLARRKYVVEEGILARASLLLNRFLPVNFRYLASMVMHLALSSLFSLNAKSAVGSMAPFREANLHIGLEGHLSNFAKPLSAMA
jgi:hypothetical protein